MIDINNAKKEFLNYVKGYDITNGRIKLKEEHILCVAENSKMIAKMLKLDEEDVRLAELIGLFHDIGRFEQAKVYDTFSDKDSGIDHAKYSLKVLYVDGLIHKFIDTDKYDEIIKCAVYYHNKAKIDDNITGKKLLFTKIIRDADKLDIYRVMAESNMEDLFWYKDFSIDKIKDKVFNDFKNNRFVDYNDIENNAEQIFTFFSYLFDFNFPYCLKILKDNNYLAIFYDKVCNTFKSKEVIEKAGKAYDMCNKYIDEKIEQV